jgi:hypothetical protein
MSVRGGARLFSGGIGSIAASPLGFLPYFIGSIQHRLPNREANLLRGIEINHQLKLFRLLGQYFSLPRSRDHATPAGRLQAGVG